MAIPNTFPSPFTDVIHEKILKALAEFFAVGGMPEAVSGLTWR